MRLEGLLLALLWMFSKLRHEIKVRDLKEIYRASFFFFFWTVASSLPEVAPQSSLQDELGTQEGALSFPICDTGGRSTGFPAHEAS